MNGMTSTQLVERFGRRNTILGMAAWARNQHEDYDQLPYWSWSMEWARGQLDEPHDMHGVYTDEITKAVATRHHYYTR